MSRNSVYLSSGDSDLWVALTVHPGSQAWSLVEVKNSDLLSSCHGYLLEIIDWPQRSQASCGILRGDSALLSRPCRKRRASFHDDGESRGFSLTAVQCVRFLLSYQRELREPLVWPQGRPVSIRVVTRGWGLLSSHRRANRHHLG